MKKNILLCAALIASLVQAEEFVPKLFTWTYAVQAKDATNFETLSEFNVKFRSLIAEMNENSSRSTGAEIYSSFLIFAREVQEAILAGANLFGSVAIAQDSLVSLAEEATEQMVEQTLEETVLPELNKDFVQESEFVVSEEKVEAIEESEATVAPCEPAFVIKFACTITDASQEEAWNLVTSALQTFADKINNNAITSDEFVESLKEIYNMLSQLEGSGLGLTAF